MSKTEADEIRSAVDGGGWNAVKSDLRLAAIWASAKEEQRLFENAIDNMEAARRVRVFVRAAR